MSTNIKIQRICQYCKNEFTAQTTSTRYCSHRCNQKHYKQKVKAKKIEQSNKETIKLKNKPLFDIQAKEFLTVKDVSILLGCSLRTTYRLIDKGTLKAVNLSERMTRISKNELNRVLNNKE